VQISNTTRTYLPVPQEDIAVTVLRGLRAQAVAPEVEHRRQEVQLPPSLPTQAETEKQRFTEGGVVSMASAQRCRDGGTIKRDDDAGKLCASRGHTSNR